MKMGLVVLRATDPLQAAPDICLTIFERWRKYCHGSHG